MTNAADIVSKRGQERTRSNNKKNRRPKASADYFLNVYSFIAIQQGMELHLPYPKKLLVHPSEEKRKHHHVRLVHI